MACLLGILLQSAIVTKVSAYAGHSLMRMILGALAAVTTLFPASTLAAPARPFESPAINWLQSNAQPIPAANPRPDDLISLVRVLDGGQVIGIGEATHGTHEDFAFKAALIRALVEHGELRVLALEANRRPGLLFDRYVRGEGGDPIEIMRTSGFFQTWQTEEFATLIGWIRAWNAAGNPQVRIIGVDAQAIGVDSLAALEWLERHRSDAARGLRARLAPIIADGKLREGRMLELLKTLDQEEWRATSSALDDLAKAIGEPKSGDSSHADAAHAAMAAKQALSSSEDWAPFATEAQKNDPELYMRRDKFMAENLLSLAAGSRVAYWAHNMHVVLGAEDDTGPAMTGGHLRRRLGNNYRIVLFEHDGGLIHAIRASETNPTPARGTPWEVVKRESIPEGLGPVLSKVGLDRFWVQLTGNANPAPAEWMAHPYRHDWPGYTAWDRPWDQPGPPLKDNADVLVFFKSVTPSRLYPFVPQR